MPLATGSWLGAYEIIELVGLGGMGEVYRARDSKLDRDVAIKVLPELFVGDPERVARFEREAKTLAALSHHNIAAIHGVVEVEGVIALVLEYVGGPTLADWIRDHGPDIVRDFPAHLADVLPIANQIVDALAAAHASGVVHRDLKPANIKLSAAGAVKVLDFGLAKAFEAQAVSASVSVSPTLTSPAGATAFGTILGTAAYMSPEQARGKAVDRRTDIWAFGCVLFEMLAGKRAFAGEDIADALASILRAEPDWTSLDPRTPPSIRRLLQRTLQKDPKRRLADAGDARFELDDAAIEPATAGTVSSTTKPRARAWKRSVFEVVCAALIASLSVYLAKAVFSPPAAPLRRIMSLPPNAWPLFTSPVGVSVAISPDGKTIVYTSQTSSKGLLVMQHIDELVAKPIPGTESGAAPFFSPDGSEVGFSANGALKRVPIAGGPATTICEVAFGAVVTASWSSDNTIVYGNPGESSGIMRVSAAGGTAQRLTTAAKGEFHTAPQLLPGGTRLLFVVVGSGQHRTVLRDLVSGAEKVVLGDGAGRYVTAGYLLYADRDNVLKSIPFDPKIMATTGSAVTVQDHVNVKSAGALNAAVADDGTIVAVPDSGQTVPRHLVWMTRDGRAVPALADNPVLDYARYPGLSADGSRLALTQGPANLGAIWTFDLNGAASPLKRTFGAHNHNLMPRWMPDGKSIIFESDRTGARAVFRMRLDAGPGEAEFLAIGQLESVSKDGAFMMFSRDDPQTSRDLWILPLTGEGKAQPWLATKAYENAAEFSPDGKWVAYSSDETDQSEIYVKQFKTGGNEVRVSKAGGHDPVWSTDGKELFFTTEGPKLMVSRLLSSAPSFSKPEQVLDKGFVGWTVGGPRTYQVARDGRFLMLQDDNPSATTRTMVIILGWFDELKRLSQR